MPDQEIVMTTDSSSSEDEEYFGEPKSECDIFAELNPKRRRSSVSGTLDEVDGLDETALVRFLSTRKKKSKRSFLRVSASLANLISPSRNKSDQDGFKVPSSPHPQVASPYRPPQPSPAKRRVQLTWVDSLKTDGDDHRTMPTSLSSHEIKRQEAIYELYRGERDIAEDLVNVRKLYRDSLVKLSLMSTDEVGTLFGNIDSLIPAHQELSQKLLAQRLPNGTTQNVGKPILSWCNNLRCYVDYCANQIKAKAVFDEKKTQHSIDDFFQRCLASPFSRKLDLWSLLDGARGRFVKYPLLIRSIIKYTANDSEDLQHLEEAVKVIEEIIREADHQAGVAKCTHSKAALTFLFDDQKVPEIENSTALICNGCMKNNKGTKLYVFVFDTVVVVSRATQQSGQQMYQVYRQPIPIQDLVVEDLADGEVKLGSFRSAFSQGGQTGKNLIRISFKDSEKGQAHTLLANDEHDKRQWMLAFQKVTTDIISNSDVKSKEKQSS